MKAPRVTNHHLRYLAIAVVITGVIGTAVSTFAAPSRHELAQQMLNSRSIKFINDSARQDIEKTAKKQCVVTATQKCARLSKSMMYATLKASKKQNLVIYGIASGASHPSTSLHYEGRAIDLSPSNGTVSKQLKKYGADRIETNSSYIHAEWK